MDKIKPKDIKPLIMPVIRLVVSDMKLTNSITNAITPTIIDIINQYINRYKSSIAVNNKQQASNNDVINSEDDKSNDDANTTINRVRVRQLLEHSINTARSDDLRLKYIAELNKFDDNYAKNSNQASIIIENVTFSVPESWRKYLANKGIASN